MNLYANQYEPETMLHPVWEGKIVYQEAVWPVYDKPGTEREDGILLPLLYDATEILAVQDYTMTKTYEAGKDYALQEGKLWIPADAAIKITPYTYFNPQEPVATDAFKIQCVHGGYLKFGNSHELTDRQYLVTYRHNSTWTGKIPAAKPGILPRFHQALQAKKPFTFGYFGDSITTGANSSGKWDIHVPPYMPIWPKMVNDRLEQLFRMPVNYVNKAVGGKSANWGEEVVTAEFQDRVPDICLVGFGMNDGTANTTTAEFERRIRSILAKLDKLNPQMEFVLLSTMLPNRDAVGFYKEQVNYEAVLETIVTDYGARAALVPMTSVHAHLLCRKRFCDMTGNNVNHPNDYLARVYAQTVLASIL